MLPPPCQNESSVSAQSADSSLAFLAVQSMDGRCEGANRQARQGRQERGRVGRERTPGRPVAPERNTKAEDPGLRPVAELRRVGGVAPPVERG
jgi:hypothetical protein